MPYETEDDSRGKSASMRSPVGSSIGRQGGKPQSGRDAEKTMGRKIMANHRKRWDAKPQGLRRKKKRYVSLAADYKGKPPETTGRKARGLRCEGTMPAGY